MVIVADNRIPGIAEVFSQFGEVRPVPAHIIQTSDLKDATALIVRSVTEIDLGLLEGTAVKFVGSATSGLDHIDVTALREHGIEVADAKGSNAPAVCDYVLTALFDRALSDDINIFDSTIGIVGVGNVGERLRASLDLLGISTLLNDPPRLESETNSESDVAFVDLSELLAGADIVTLHVPLSSDGLHPTAGLIGRKQLASMKNGAWLINTSRGGIIDEGALIATIEPGNLNAVIDTWTGEPSPNCELVTAARVATPHIAGYGVESKARATEAIGMALAEWANTSFRTSDTAASLHLPVATPGPDVSDAAFCSSITRQAYDITRDHLHMRGMCSFAGEKRAEYFRELRTSYRLRNEFSSHFIAGSMLTGPQKQLARGLGFKVE